MTDIRLLKGGAASELKKLEDNVVDLYENVKKLLGKEEDYLKPVRSIFSDPIAELLRLVTKILLKDLTRFFIQCRRADSKNNRRLVYQWTARYFLKLLT